MYCAVLSDMLLMLIARTMNIVTGDMTFQHHLQMKRGGLFVMYFMSSLNLFQNKKINIIKTHKNTFFLSLVFEPFFLFKEILRTPKWRLYRTDDVIPPSYDVVSLFVDLRGNSFGLTIYPPSFIIIAQYALEVTKGLRKSETAQSK